MFLMDFMDKISSDMEFKVKAKEQLQQPQPTRSTMNLRVISYLKLNKHEPRT